MSDEALIPIVAVTTVFGAPLVWFVVDTIASNWRQVRVAEQNAHLKQQMVERGYSADEIVRVLEAGVPVEPAKAEKVR
ncbi:MAG: hypothetical protein K2X87_31785 [Gemmataceae bacterium]|nr:hypothetical protein [Gemmataceae bacterium]